MTKYKYKCDDCSNKWGSSNPTTCPLCGSENLHLFSKTSGVQTWYISGIIIVSLALITVGVFIITDENKIILENEENKINNKKTKNNKNIKKSEETEYIPQTQRDKKEKTKSTETDKNPQPKFIIEINNIFKKSEKK